MATALAVLVAAIGVVCVSTSCSNVGPTDAVYSFQETTSERRVDDYGDVFENRRVVQYVLPLTVRFQSFNGEGAPEVEYVLFSDKGEAYHRVTWTPPTWRRREAPVRTEPEFLRPSDQLDERLASLNDVEQLGTEELNGQTVSHHRGVRDLEQLIDAAASRGIVPFIDEQSKQQYRAGLEVVDIWSSADDDRLVKMVVRGIFLTVGSHVGYTSEVTSEFSRYNEEFDISPPPTDQIVENAATLP